ncbi:adenylate/guanylate cyclase domain-containing protein [Leptospira sp. 96542]|nr:adenylate/guanylate cyclase domain-containing protein [Leptospira sp. 96542]
MLEISSEIPFLDMSSIQFLVWNGDKDSLNHWDWTQGEYAFLQIKKPMEVWELRFGSPIWGLDSSIPRIEFPFFSESDYGSTIHLIKHWKENLQNKTITIFIEESYLLCAKYLFAVIQKIGNLEKPKMDIVNEFSLTDEWKEKFLSIDFQKKYREYQIQKNGIIYPPLVRIDKDFVFHFPNESGVSKNLNSEDSNQSTEIKLDDSTETTELLIDEKQKEIPSVEENESLNSAKKTESVEETVSEAKIDNENIELDTSSKTKFSLQFKLMVVISLLFALSVSAIIYFASDFFKKSIELQLLGNNLRMTEIVGSKVNTDILGVVEKGRQIAITLTTQGLPESERNLLLRNLFQNDKEFIYLGIFENRSNQLIKKKEVFNEEELKLSAVTEEDFHNMINRNKDLLADAFSGQPVLFNSSPGFQEPSFAIAIPTTENGELDNVLVMVVKLSKIISAFSKEQAGIETTFMVNGSGIVIAHPTENLILAATDLSNMVVVKTMLTSNTSNGQTSYKDEELGGVYLGSYKKIGFANAGIISIVSEDVAYADVYRSQKINLYIAGIGLCSALIFVFLFSKTITKPVLQLLSATLEIAKGNFKIGIKPTTQDEVGLLTRYFIDMGKGLEEREKVKNILGSMIDPVVVQEAMVDLQALKRGSETLITAFFSDVAGFSTISEQLKSADLAALLNEYLSAMTLILKKHEGVLDKYIGDAIVGIFNAPVSVLDHELKAARASAEMILKLNDLREYWTRNNLYSKEAQTMDARIGLNSGLAKVGFMGTDALASYTMMGDTVNLAARLEAAGKDYGVNVLVTDPIRDKIQDEMSTRYLDLVRVKGKNEPVKIHELIGFKSMLEQNILESATLYEEGFSFYLNQNWEKAIQSFKNAEKTKGRKDKACAMLIERCEEYKLDSPGKNWDGVFTRTHK